MNLKDIESRLQSLLEIDLPGLLPGKKVDDVIIQKLAAAIQVNTITLEDGTLLAPNTYTLLLHPQALTTLQDKRLLAVILNSITTVAQEAGLRFTITPSITLSSDVNLSQNDAHVVASHRAEPMADTIAIPNNSEAVDENGKIPDN